MLHAGRGFVCMKCGCRDSKDVALQHALYDYKNLYGEKITNQGFREFVGITSPSTANKILKRLGYQSIGTTKNRVYLIPSPIR